MIQPCPTCSKDFETNGGRSYCSKHCRKKAKKARYRVKLNRSYVCLQCKTEFKRNSDRGYTYVFCSSECASKSRVKIVPEEFYTNDGELHLCTQCGGFLEEGRRKWCVDCYDSPEYQREKRLQKVYGISSEEYEAMVQAQGGLCAICRGVEPRKNRDGSIMNLSIDHSHRTGANRELLCNRCNVLLGQVDDSQELLLRALAYLRKHDGVGEPFIPDNPETRAARDAAFEKSLSPSEQPLPFLSDVYKWNWEGTLNGTLPDAESEVPKNAF